MNYIRTNTIGQAWLKAIETIVNNGSRTVYDREEVILEQIPLIIEMSNPLEDDLYIEKYGNWEYIEFMKKNFGIEFL